VSLVLLCRHGETKLNASSTGSSAERIRGHLDVPLDANGLQEAIVLAKRITNETRIRRVYSSPLIRALMTAKLVAAYSRAPLERDDALKPWDVGRWAGQPVAKVLPLMEKLVTTPDVEAPGGESFSAFADKYLAALKQILAAAKEKAEDLCVVTHTRNLQLTKAWIAAGAKPDMSYDANVVNDYSDETSTGDWLTLRAA
jgi:probable phosphoglycerate mutase